ncbi:hypothetical protein SRB17_81790 [Streptomyces sp. RB17]|nr:hypothetical protein [Streptomyces sp. RB17]
MWYASNPTMTVKDTAKAQKVTEAFNTLLDAVADYAVSDGSWTRSRSRMTNAATARVPLKM